VGLRERVSRREIPDRRPADAPSTSLYAGCRDSARGQTTAEFALALPVLLLLLSGVMLSGFYAFRAAAGDWGVFIGGVTAGVYPEQADGRARSSIPWPDIRDRLTVELDGGARQARARLAIRDSRPWMFGLQLVEAQQGTGAFRLWRFYPGPPAPGGVE
jgi:hypothetical protein